MYKFEKLNVWHDSVSLIKLSYLLIERLPHNEKNNLSDQLRRASTSVSLNIAEGSGAGNDVEFNRFLAIARKSLFETICIIMLVKDLYKIEAKELEITIERIIKQIVALQKILQKKV